MYTRSLNDDERSVLNHLVELCCEAYWQEAEQCRICFDGGQLVFTAKIDSSWSLLEREELSIEDYASIVRILQGIFEPADVNANAVTINNRIVTVTLDTETGRPIMNLRLDFNGKDNDPADQVIELTIEDLVEGKVAPSTEDEPLDSEFIN
jgi:hypothetical protein